jgi:hypothetical protein
MASAQLMIVIGMARLAAAIVYWLPRWHVLTNRRVIDVSGVRTPIISACPLTDVRNTFLRANNIEKMTRLGTILFVTDRADDPPRCWESIADAEAVHTEIRRAIESALDAAGM